MASALAAKLGLSLDLSGMDDSGPKLAAVAEELCIGCCRCSKVCPTDALVGAPKQIHAVVADACIACAKCVEVCPTECLRIHPVKVTLRNWRCPSPESTPAKAA